MRRAHIRLLAVTALLGLGGCGSGEGDRADLPVSPPDGPVDTELAARGETLFTSRGCSACHTVGGGRLVGPDLAGVTERRSFGWTFHMVTNPDSMLQNDATARALLAEYFTPMTDVGITPEEFRALYEHLRAAEAGTASGDAGGDRESP